MLKDSLTLCDWIFPNLCCPDPAREYAGDLGLEAELYRAITGDEIDADELDQRAEGLVDLYRAITVRDWNTPDLRGAGGYEGGGRGADRGGGHRGHDNLAAWYFEVPVEPEPGDPEAPPPVQHLDRKQFEEGKTLLYRRMGWDEATGAPTRAKLEASGRGEVADGLERLGLLPE